MKRVDPGRDGHYCGGKRKKSDEGGRKHGEGGSEVSDRERESRSLSLFMGLGSDKGKRHNGSRSWADFDAAMHPTCSVHLDAVPRTGYAACCIVFRYRTFVGKWVNPDGGCGM